MIVLYRHQYQLDTLKCFCIDYLIDNLCDETAVNVLMVADLYGADELKIECIDYINQNGVMTYNNWQALIDSKNPKLIDELYLDLYDKYIRSETQYKK